MTKLNLEIEKNVYMPIWDALKNRPTPLLPASYKFRAVVWFGNIKARNMKQTNKCMFLNTLNSFL